MNDSLLLTIIIVIIAAVSNWLQRRAQAAQEEKEHGELNRPAPPVLPRSQRPGHPPARPSPAPAPSIETRLERELRRLLGDEGEAPPTPSPVAPPRLPDVKPPPVVQAPPAPRPVPQKPVLTPEFKPRPLAPRPVIGPAAPVWTRGQELHQRVAERFRKLEAITAKNGPRRLAVVRTHRGSGSPELAPFLALTREPAAARQAFVASLIFSAPKGLET